MAETLEFSHAPRLEHTLQTYVGMIMNDGKPLANQDPNSAYDPDPKFTDVTRASNEYAIRNEEVTLPDIKKLIYIRKRVDLEKVVALMLSTQGERERAYLRPYVEHMIGTCWMMPADDEPLLGDAVSQIAMIGDPAQKKLLTMTKIFRSKISSLAQLPTPDLITRRLGGLINALRSVRRRRPKMKNEQALTLPPFLATRTKPEDQKPISPNAAVIVSKKVFRQLNRLMWRLEGNPDPSAVYIRKVKAHAKEVELSEAKLGLLMRSTDSLAVGFSFIAFQRRLQLKVVSDLPATSFLAKGEGALVLQNRPDVWTSFELAIAKLLRESKNTDWEAASAVVPPPGTKVTSTEQDATLLRKALLDTCLMMREYVTLFGGGDFTTLTYKRGKRGGGGRGPVDFYNLLVDVLREVKSRLEERKEMVEIGPCHKFLAKDIMSWNNAWKDDAFADGKIPGWVEYLKTHEGPG